MNQMFRMQVGMVVVVAGLLTGCGSSGDGGGSYNEIEEILSHHCNIESIERFAEKSDTHLVDTLTCLEWQYLPQVYKPYVTQESYNKGNYSDTTGDTAQTACKNLGEGWRLPTKYEALSAIIDPEADMSAIPYRGKIPSSLYDKGDFFTGATWTSTPVAGHKEYRWFVEFLDGMAQTDSNRVDLASFEVFCVKPIEH